jgi:hypothetical protein
MRELVNYRGSRGVTRHCIDALSNFLQETRETGIALLLSGPKDPHGCRSHALLLTLDGLVRLVIPDGFASGYGGTGPAGLSTAIALLHSRNWDINEVEVAEVLFERVCRGEASRGQLDQIIKAPKKPISHVFDYLRPELLESETMSDVWRDAPVNIPLPLIDPRIFDIAISFWGDPDSSLHKAYRRLEDLVRERTGFNGVNDHGAKLFSRALGNDKSPFVWRVNEEDSVCYAPLFTASFSGFRNPRAHRDPGQESDIELAMEFLQLNMLFTLEAQLVKRGDARPDNLDEEAT